MLNQRSGVTVQAAGTDGDFAGPFSNSHLLPWQDSHTVHISVSASLSGWECVHQSRPHFPPSTSRLRELIFTDALLLCWWGWTPHLSPSYLWGRAPPLNSQTQRKFGGNLLRHFPNIQTGRWGEWDSAWSIASWALSLLPKHTPCKHNRKQKTTTLQSWRFLSRVSFKHSSLWN